LGGSQYWIPKKVYDRYMRYIENGY
jgi:hypothetical protein